VCGAKAKVAGLSWPIERSIDRERARRRAGRAAAGRSFCSRFVARPSRTHTDTDALTNLTHPCFAPTLRFSSNLLLPLARAGLGSIADTDNKRCSPPGAPRQSAGQRQEQHQRQHHHHQQHKHRGGEQEGRRGGAHRRSSRAWQQHHANPLLFLVPQAPANASAGSPSMHPPATTAAAATPTHPTVTPSCTTFA
jgi:hypothetical protein